MPSYQNRKKWVRWGIDKQKSKTIFRQAVRRAANDYQWWMIANELETYPAGGSQVDKTLQNRSWNNRNGRGALKVSIQLVSCVTFPWKWRIWALASGRTPTRKHQPFELVSPHTDYVFWFLWSGFYPSIFSWLCSLCSTVTCLWNKYELPNSTAQVVLLVRATTTTSLLH